MRRATVSMRPKLISAVASATIGGTTVTGILRLVASATSMLSGVIDCEATARSFGLAAITSRSIRSCRSENRMSLLRTAATSVFLGMIRLESGLTLTLATRRRRSIALRATGWVMKMRGRIRYPPHDAGDAVDRDLRAVRDAAGGVEHAEHHGDAALARERGEMRGGTAELGDHAGDARQHVAQRRAGDARDQHVAGRNPRQFALAVHHHRTAGTPADARRVSAETGMLAPDLVGHGDWLDGERARLQELEALMVERPFDLDWTAYDGFCFAHHAAKRHRLRGVK